MEESKGQQQEFREENSKNLPKKSLSHKEKLIDNQLSLYEYPLKIVGPSSQPRASEASRC
jgi:hypothetical protein